ncbi:MAG TPA: NUDIX domain-containing protein [Polyangiaceae bacterium]|nr:NUDIX domain-containing protein [Polyangiaceae bacterium]
MVWRTKKKSAGILVYRRDPSGLAVLLAHPGGPIFRRRDAGAWTIPKGEIEPDEEPLAAARRELTEETGFSVDGPFLELGTVKQKNGKIVHAFAVEGVFDPTKLTSTTFRMEWPPRTGSFAEFPEIDRAEYFSIDVAREKLNLAQSEFLDRLLTALGQTSS